MAVILTEESRGTLALGPELPALPDLASRAGMDGTLASAVELWTSSWSEDDGERLRERAYHGVAESLAATLGAETARGLLADVRVAVGAARTVGDELDPALALQVERASAHHAEAQGAMARGRLAEAYVSGLAAADALRAVTPQSVAGALVGRAGTHLADIPADSLDPVVRERAERLVRGARVALEGEDWARAVRRAYYACQLLGLSPH
jgi:hypothetical protein